MGLLDVIKKNEEPSPALEQLTSAQEQLNSGEYQNALATLIIGFQKDVNFKPLYTLAATCLDKLGGEEEKALFERAVANFNDFTSFDQLGSHFFNLGHYPLAQPFLAKALALNPQSVNTAHDLAIAYARRFQIAKAVQVLSQVNAQEDFWALYFLTKCRILNQDMEGVAETIENLDHFLNEQQEEEGLSLVKLKVQELKESLIRYQTIPNPSIHIRDWHFIQYGGAVLDYFEEQDQYVAGGRYVASWGSTQSIRQVVTRLQHFLTANSVRIRQVKALPDRNSEIIGRVIARVLGAHFTFYTPNESSTNCLVVTADTSYLNQHQELVDIQEDQILFSLNHDWLHAAYVTPDIIGFMTQSYYYPWEGGGFTVTDDGRTIEKTKVDTRLPGEIAEDIAQLVPEPIEDQSIIEFYVQRQALLKGIGWLTNKKRYNFLEESPVPGSYFGY